MKGPNGIFITLFAFISAIYLVYTFGGFISFEIEKSNSQISPSTKIQYFSSPIKESQTTTFLNFETNKIPKNVLCPNLNIQDFNSSKGILNSKVAIVLAVLTQNDYGDYMISINTTQCYASHFGYQMHFINMTENPKIQQLCNHTDVC
uniref:Transmembrane protein n=1 Tax=Panagrolaimus davidi TaxID=227884 RepID=A0A914QRL6_9BILA